MSDNQVPSSGLSTSAAVTVSNGVLLAALIFLFLVVVFVFLLYLYAKRYMGPNLLDSSQPHFTFVTDNLPTVRRGLDTAVLESIPVKVFDAKEFKEGLECAVCLSDIAEGEELRLLPKCNHGFHVKCIDMWFHSHSTCPLCRSAVGDDSVPTGQEQNAESLQAQSLDAVSREGYVTEPRVLPTNVLFWGTGQDDVTTGTVQEATSSSSGTGSGKRGGGPGMLVIDIPRRTMENMVPSPMSPLPPSVMPMEEMKSPLSARFRSLKRLLSRGKQVVGPSGSPRVGDIEQGIVLHTPKTPRSFQG
ncbi:Ring-H2 zinc finger protein [Rhynchospora pubera]|uniref:RING-type E3 ubiquitin transferase n=1 Tax=Rhynchospora pubera TaxID=906938 RepID=A0AAV8FGQ5_9POAL|nr:Ring-H2 zinc finger protein [Rhynchospora pubera]